MPGVHADRHPAWHQDKPARNVGRHRLEPGVGALLLFRDGACEYAQEPSLPLPRSDSLVAEPFLRTARTVAALARGAGLAASFKPQAKACDYDGTSDQPDGAPSRCP